MQMIDDSQMIQVLFRLPSSDVLTQENHTGSFCLNMCPVCLGQRLFFLFFKLNWVTELAAKVAHEWLNK